MQKFKLGLTVPAHKKKKHTPVMSRESVFLSQDDEQPETEIDTSARGRTQQNRRNHQKVVNQQLSGYKTDTKKITEQLQKAVEEDPTIFDYDAVYDDLKDAEKKQKEATKSVDTKKARYINNLLEMAEIRKRDRLLAEEKKVAREREAEGDEFADKEAFMTEAYKKQKAELLRIEAEEKAREEEMQKKKTMSTFYKQVLDKKEAIHQAVMDAMAKKTTSTNTPASVASPTGEQDVKLAEHARKEGKSVRLNDNNEIVDKRELLGAGLNVKPKFGSFSSLASTDQRVHERQLEYEEYKRKKVAEYEARRQSAAHNSEREKLSREVERQLVEQQEKEKEEEKRKQEELEKKATAKRTTEEVALSARERFLARKKQRVQEPST